MAEIWAVAVGTAVTAYSARKSAQEQSKENKELSELGFQRQVWLGEQDRKFQLQDRKYIEDSIGGFRGFAPEEARTFNGQPVTPPEPTSTAGLADWDPNIDRSKEYGLLPNQNPTPWSGNGY